MTWSRHSFKVRRNDLFASLHDRSSGSLADLRVIGLLAPGVSYLFARFSMLSISHFMPGRSLLCSTVPGAVAARPFSTVLTSLRLCCLPVLVDRRCVGPPADGLENRSEWMNTVCFLTTCDAKEMF